jgi:protein-tyrosine phosphatase
VPEAGPLQVDLHSHLLPGVDDGARDEAAALAMMRVAAADGTRVIAATPHAGEVAPETILEAVQRLNELAQATGVPLHVVHGSEYRLSRALIAECQRGRLVTLNSGPYVLVELPSWNEWPEGIQSTIAGLQDGGLRPVLAHPERHTPVQRRPELVLEPVQAGVLVQLNAASLLGRHGRAAQRAAVLLLRARAAHLIASDAHDLLDRPPRVADALTRAAALTGEEYARWMRWAAAQVVVGTPLDLPEPEPEILCGGDSWIERLRGWLNAP